MKQKIFIVLLVTFNCMATKIDAQTFNVGVGGTYTTLNAAVTAYNSMVLTQPVTFLLADAAYTVTTPISIATNATATSTRSLTIKPAPGVTATINGNINNDAVIKIFGDYIIIDGSNNGSNTKNLTITNQSFVSPGVLRIGGADQANTASFITLKNTILINGINSSIGFSVSAPTSAASGGYFNNITIENNSIQKSLQGINVTAAIGPFQNGTTVSILNNNLAGTGPNAIRNVGIFLTGLSYGCTVEGNTIGNFETAIGETDKGIFVSTACSTVVIKNNSITNLQYTGTSFFAPVGIDISASGGNNIQVLDNQVSDILSTGTGVTKGIALNGSAILVNIINNKINNIKNSNASGQVYAVEFNPTSAGNGGKLFNNFIFDIAGTAATYGIIAIGPGVRQIAFNTVLLTVSSGLSYAFYAGHSISGRVECRNNNFINRSAVAGSSYAILHANTLTFSGIDNNNFEGNPLGQRSGSNLTTLAQIQSFYGAASVNIPPVFISATDLHLAATGNETLDNLGAPVSGIITDIDGDARSSTTPDIGADEFGSVASASLIINCSPSTSSVCPGATFNLNYTVQGGTPAAGNSYTAQLSIFTGSFTVPVPIGSVESIATTGTISVTIPLATSGNFYRIRVVSSTPAFIGNDNGVNLVIANPVTSAITGPATSLPGVENAFSVTERIGSTYNWLFTEGIQNSGGNSSNVTATFNNNGSQLITVTETAANGCQGTPVTKGVAISNGATNVVLSESLTGNFSTLKEAFDAINAGGGSGSVTATIVGNTAEIAQARLVPTAYNILVVPQGNRVVSCNLDTSMIMLKGADNVTINGQFLSGANTLTFRNTSTNATASVIRLEDGASNNAVRKCIIEGSATSTFVSSGALVINNGDKPGDNLNNIIDGNLIKPSTPKGLTFGIVVGSGNTSTTNTFTGTIITNNLLENVFSLTNLQSTGILIRNNTINTLIKGNSVYNTLPLNSTRNDVSFFGIRINAINSTLGTGNVIDSNFIGGTAPGATGGQMQFNSPNNNFFFNGIYLNENITPAPSAVTRNVVRNISVEAANNTSGFYPVFIGMDIVKANLQQLENNSIGNTSNNSITITMKPATNAYIGSYGITLSTACANPVANNFIGGFAVTVNPLSGSTAPATFSLIQISGGAAVVHLKKNMFGSSNANNIAIVNNSTTLFELYGVNNYNLAATAAIKLDSNTVQNISATNTAISAIDNYNYTAAPTSATVTINGNTVSNLNVSGTSGSINAMASTTETSVTNLTQTLTVNGNSINNLTATSGTGISLYGINILNNSTAVNRSRGSIANNSITNIINSSTGIGGITAGLNYSNDIVINDSMVFSNNTFTNITDAGTLLQTGLTANSNGMLIGMNKSASNGIAIIRDNIISGIASTSNTNNGIRINGIAVLGNAAIIERNRLYDLQNAATINTARLEAILLRSRSDDANTSLVRNNMIAINSTTTAQIAGIRLQGSGQKSNIYHNSILTEGSSATNSYTVLKDAAAVADVKNNILYNAVTGAGAAFAIGLETDPTGYTGNNNYFVSPATASLAQVGTTSHTLNSWQATTTQDDAAQQGQSGVNTSAANLFVDKTTATLLINTANGTEAEKASDKGIALSASVPTDFLLALRNTSTPDIGAHEFLFTGSGVNWTGNVSTEWENAANWGNNQVPNADTKVIIPGGRPRYPIISVSTTVKSISTAPNTSVNVAAGVTLLIAGN